MGEYEKYIARLKAVKSPFDEVRMSHRLAWRIGQRAPVFRLALGTALAVFLFGLAGYWFGSANTFGNGEALSEYVFQAGNLNGDPIMNYVFVD